MNNKLLLAGIITGLCFSVNSIARDEGFYVGGTLGYVNLDQDEEQYTGFIIDNGLTGSVSVDDEDLGWKAFGGYRFNQNFALEVGYVNLGKAVADFMTDTPDLINSSANSELTGFNISGVVSYPIDPQVDIFAKGGIFIWDAETTASIISGAGSQTLNSNGEDAVFGIGALYHLTDDLSLRAEWERYSDIDNADVDAINFGIQYKF